jgi:hypothetical protein
LAEKSLGYWQLPQLPQLPPPLLLPIDGEGGRKPAEEEVTKIRESDNKPGNSNIIIIIKGKYHRPPIKPVYSWPMLLFLKTSKASLSGGGRDPCPFKEIIIP